MLCKSHWKPWPSGVSLESPGLENIPQVPGNRAEVDQNHDARNAVSATVSVLKLCGCISAHKLESERSKSFAVSISLETRAIRRYFRVRGSRKHPPSSGKSSPSWSKSRCAKGGPGSSFSLKVRLRYISASRLQSAHWKSFAVSISPQSKAIRS